MTSVEKRRSSRKNSRHRKQSDGGFSDTSSGGSFLDENDREVSSLTDRAFRSLCIGDEAVYNDSDLSLSSPSTQRDRQLAFSQSSRDIGTEAREVEELKRAAHENFGLRMQQYGQAWIHGGMYGAEIHSDPQWGGYGQQTQGRVSATFQHSFVETSHLGKSLNEEELSSFSNGATELSSQRRSRSRVSSLIRAFNSEGHRDGAGMNDKFGEWNNEPSWDKSALMSIQRELSEFSTSYQQNFNSGHYSSAGPFSSRDTNFYSSEVAAVAHMSHNSVSSFMRSSHSSHGMSAQVNCNSNFFIHSEFSPFKVWRDHNRFPFQQGEVSGFMHASDFPKWYETPMYKELSLENQPQGPYRGIRHHRNSLAPMVLPVPSYNTATSSVLQKASAVEKRCESELASHYPHRRRTQSLGTNKLPSQRPSTASPSIEMSRRVRDTISSVKALQQKIEIMTEQNITTGVLADGVLYRNDNFIQSGNSVPTLRPNVSSNTSTTPFNVSQMLTPSVHAHQEADTSGFQQYNVSPQPVEHPPVRAESRGGTPDIRMSTYKSRATSLLFNLKDNRKRVKSTYSPTKFKGLDTQQKNKQPSAQEQRETVIDIPGTLDSEMQTFQLEESTRTDAAVNQYHSPGLTLTTPPTRENTGQYPGNTSGDYQTAQMQGQMVRHAGFSGFIPENYTSNQLTNGQNPNEYLASFTPYGQGGMHHIGTSEGLKQPYTDMDASRLNTDNNQNREHLISKANTDEAFNETVGRMLTRVDRYDQLKNRKYDYNNVTYKDERRQTNNQDTEKFNLKAAISPQKQETALESSKQENPLSRIKDLEKVELKESFGFVISSHKNHGSISTNVSKQLQEQQGRLENERSYHRYSDQEYNNRHELDPKANKTMIMQKTGQMKTGTPFLEGEEIQTIQQIEAKPQFENNNQKKSSPNSNNAPDPAKKNMTKDRQFVDISGEQVMAEHRTEKHTQAELAKAQQRAQIQQPTAESAGLILVEQTGSENVKTEESKSEPMRPESVVQTKEEHIKDEKKLEQAKQSRQPQSELTPEEQTETKQTRVQKLTDEPNNVTEKSSNKYIREEQGKQVKAEQGEKEKLKEEPRKTELTKTEQTGPAKSQQAETEKITRGNITTEHVKEEQLSSEQAKREHMAADQIRTEKVNAKPTGAKHGKAEQTEQMKEPQSKTKHMKTKEAEVGEVKRDNVRVEDARQAKNENDSVHLEGINAEKPPRHIFTAKDTKLEERKPTQTKLEETKLKRTKAELQKTENLLGRSAELASKLAATQHARSEPDRVEQVKTELAKAKAELAKIKEKMRGEQKEKLSSFILKEGATSKNNVPLNVTKNEDNKNQDKLLQMQIDRMADDYNHLREKYGFTYSISAIINKGSTTESVPSKDANETKGSPLDIVDAGNNDKSKDGRSPTSTFMTANMENKGELALKHSEVTENQHVDEESKKLKLSSVNSFPTNEHKSENRDIVADNLKNHNVENLEKCGSVKETILQQRDSDLAKLRPPERKPKTVEHRVSPGKDLHVTPPRVLSHKDKTQTKQEILTSKIKAHAEKEISAIKEKGFVLGKNSGIQLPSSHICQRPPSQEASKRHDSAETGIISAKQPKDSSEVQIEPAKFVLPLSSATTPVTSATATNQLADHLEKPRQTNQTASSITTAPVGLGQKQLGVMSPVSNKEQAPQIAQEKQLVNHDAISKIHKEELCDKHAINNEILNKRSEGSTQATSVKAANPNHLSTKKAESTETACKDSASRNITLGPTEAPVTDDNLEIMGIMVTVRDRKTPVNSGLETNSTGQQKNEKQNNTCEQDKRHPSSGIEENTPSNEVNLVKANDVQKTLSKLKDNHSNNIYSEIVQETSILEKRNSNMTGNVTASRTNLQQESSTTNAKPQSEMQLEQVTDKSVPFTVTVSSNDKVLAETQPIVYQQYETTEKRKDKTNKTLKENLAKSTGQMMTEEEKSKQREQTTQSNEGLIFSAVDNQSSSNDAETVSQKLTVKEDTTAVLNDSKSCNIDGRNTSLMEENSYDSSSSKTSTKTRTSNNSAENEKRDDSQKLRYNETQMTDNSQEDDNVHIDSIAIRVVPAVTEENIVKDNVKIVGNDHTVAFSSDVGLANRKQQTASFEKQVNTPNSERCSKDFTPASSEQERKESLEDKLAVQQVLSSVRKLSDTMKMNNKLSCTIPTSENTKAENGKPESNTQPAEEDYFQVEGQTETSNNPDNLTVGDASKGRGHPGLQPNKTAISNEAQKEGKSDIFVFSMDQGERKADDLTSGSKNMNREKLETEDIKASEQTYGSMERWSNNEKKKADQANHIRKQHHRENQSSLSAMDRQSSRNSPPTNPNTTAEKQDLKPKPKEKVTTIPEISAIADYARLKVIVSEDKEVNKIQEFPPNKKEGFFPLIQTRHSRRPVFTADPQDLSVEEKSFSKKTEMNSKVNKEPKSLVFPIMEKEHQRTGMFKLSDKDTQEKMHTDSKMITGIVETAVNHKETERSPTAQIQHMTGAGCQRVDQSPGHPNNHPLQSKTSLFAANMPKNNYEELTYLDRSFPPHPNLGQINHRKDNMSDNKSEKQDNDTGAKVEDSGTNQLKRLATQHEGPKTKQQDRREQLVEDRVFWSEREKQEEDMRLKQIIEESRSSLADEERRMSQREEEKRVEDHEAIAIMIKEREEKQRKAESRPKEETEGKERDEERAALKEKHIKAQQKQEEMRIGKKDEKRIKIEDEMIAEDENLKNRTEDRRKKVDKQVEDGSIIQKEQQIKAADEARQNRLTQEEHQRRTEEEPKRRATQDKQQERAAGGPQWRAIQNKQKNSEEEHQRFAQEERRQSVAQEEDQRRATEEQKRRPAQDKQQQKAAEQQQSSVVQEQQNRAAKEQQKRAALDEQQRKAADDQKRKAALEEQQRRAAEEEQRKAVLVEQQRRAAEEEQRKAVLVEQQRRAAKEQQRRAALEEQQRSAAEEEQRKAALEEQQKRAAEEEQKKTALVKQQRRAAEDEQRRVVLEEQQKRAAEEQQRRAAIEEQQQRTALKAQQRRAAEEEQRRAVVEEQQRRAAEEEQRRVVLEEQQKRAAEEQQRRAAAEEQQKRFALEAQQRRAAKEEQRRAVLEEQQRRAAEERQRRVAEEKQQRRAADEQKRRAAEEEQRRAALEKQQRRAAEEQQRRAAQEEKERRTAEEEQRSAALEAQQRRVVLQEQKRKTVEEHQSRPVQDEKERRAAEEQQRRAAEGQQSRLTEEEKQRRAAQEHQKREPEKQQRTGAQEEHQRRPVQREQQRRAAEEQQRRGVQEEQQKRVCLTEAQRQAKKIKEKTLEENKTKEREEKGNHIPEEIIAVIQEQNKLQQQIEKQRREKGEFTRVQKHEEDELKKAAQSEKITKEREDQQAKNESSRSLEEKRVAEELMLVERESLIHTKPREEDINLVTQREKARAAQMEKQRRAAQKMDALQYYAITSTGTERKSKERQQSSPLPSQQRNNPLRLESTDEEIHNSRHYRPHAPASPAPSLPRSNTSSPALGAKPSMFRVKDNTIRGSFFTKSVKPRFHRSFGEVSSMDRASDRGEDEQEIMRHSAGTPVHPDMGLNRLAAINESSASPSTSLSKHYSTSISHHRPYSRRSIVMDEDESRSVISNLSEDVESLATSAADLADIRGLLDCDRPDSACSFSSDVSRSLGKPPTVPPKSEKALRRAQRLTSRRMKKDLSRAAAGTPVGVEKEVSSIPSSSTEVCSSNCHAVASPHFSPPVSLAHAPALGSSLPSSSSEHQSVHRSFNASTHATGPVSLPFSLPHATSTLPAVSPHASGPASQSAAPKTVAHVPSSPTLYHANHPTPVTQYHVESSRYPQSFPLTQRKVLQDLGSGQYFVVDVPVQVKTKTFFDPETGKYVQLNVRESGQSISQPQPQPKTQLKPQQQPLPQPSIAGKPVVFYHGYHNYPQSYPPAAINSVHPNRSSAPGTLHHDQQPPRETHSFRISAVEGEQNSQGPCYSPEKTPYMDTVNDADKSYNPVNSTQNSYESFSECETNSQITGSSVCENDNLARSLYQPRDIITMSELEDFMEVSDW